MKKIFSIVILLSLTFNFPICAGLDKDEQVCEQEEWNNQFWVDGYVRIYSDQDMLVFAKNQYLYLPEEQRYILAQDAVAGQQLAPNFTVEKLEMINQKIDIYALTITSHRFQVSKYDVIAWRLHKQHRYWYEYGGKANRYIIENQTRVIEDND